jgi:hypothetical protein
MVYRHLHHTDTTLTLKWHDKWELSTIHEPRIMSTGKIDHRPIMKSLCMIHEYNENRDLVNRTDMQISFSASIWKTIKVVEKRILWFIHTERISIGEKNNANWLIFVYEWYEKSSTNMEVNSTQLRYPVFCQKSTKTNDLPFSITDYRWKTTMCCMFRDCQVIKATKIGH